MSEKQYTYFILTGEPSGAMHAARLINKLKKEKPNARFVGTGNSAMHSAGCDIVLDINKMAFMGVVAVLKNLKAIRQNFNIVKQALLSEQPDMLILVDYPSFNLKIAEFAKKNLPDTKIIYYIPPKIWAWKSWRVHKVGKLCNEIWCIFPFEVELYTRYGYNAKYVGNPTLEAIESKNQRVFQPRLAENEFRTLQPILAKKNTIVAEKNTIALLPGSRISEVEHCLPRMLEAVRLFPQYQSVIVATRAIPEQVYKRLASDIPLLYDNHYEHISNARAAIVNSGTATLETAVIGTPQVAVYHIACAWLLRPIWKLIFPLHCFTLVNILWIKSGNAQNPKAEGGEVIKELIGFYFTTDRLVNELRELLENKSYRSEMQKRYDKIRYYLRNSQLS